MTKPTKAIGYCRVSTKAQGANGYSLDAQRDAIEKHCAANNFDLVGFVPDVMSGSKGDRLHGRAAAVAAIRAHVADVLVISAVDRATRDTLDGLGLLVEAKTEGWRVVTVRGEDSDTMSALELTIKLAFAQEERERISARTKAGLARVKRERERDGLPPLGNERQVPADIVEQIVRLHRDDGLGAKAIATRLTRESVPAPGGSRWHYSTVRNVLRRAEAAA
ncbi:recombinase family protein [Mycolicibacterium sp.]|uniref:recombinase family protein n=1 Tax=Mycolicibacterium sp. TaxID=2320850 RepID=UPI003D138192